MVRPASTTAFLIAATTLPTSAGSLGAGLPAGAVARRAADRGLGRAADPHRQVGLHRLGRDRRALEAIVPALEIDAVLAPQPGDDLERLVGAPAARPGVDVERLPFRPERAADAEGRQQAALGQHVDGGALLGEQHRIAQRQRHDVHAEAQAARAAGQGGHRRHAFEDRLAADQAIGLPQRIDAARLAEIDPAPVVGGAGEGKFHQAEADGDAHAGTLDLGERRDLVEIAQDLVAGSRRGSPAARSGCRPSRSSPAPWRRWARRTRWSSAWRGRGPSRSAICAQPLDALDDVEAAARAREPAVAIVDHAPQRMVGLAAQDDRRMRPLRRLGPRPDRIEVRRTRRGTSASSSVHSAFMASTCSRICLKRVS